MFHQLSSDRPFTLVSKVKCVSTQSENPICPYFSLDTHVMSYEEKRETHIGKCFQGLGTEKLLRSFVYDINEMSEGILNF